jgi:hypothetical protein
MAYYRFSLELITPAVNQRRTLKSLHSRLASIFITCVFCSRLSLLAMESALGLKIYVQVLHVWRCFGSLDL